MDTNSSAATPVRAKEPRVWLDMDQAALDDAYDQAVYAPNRDQVHERRQAISVEVRSRMPPLRFAYGPTEIEGLDVYRTTRPNAPIFVYTHGGAWRSGKAADFGFLAELFVNAGAHCVILDFLSVDDAGGDLFQMVDQVRRGVAWVYRNAEKFGGDPSRLYAGGHSSGGHLTGNILVTDWEKDFGLPRDIIKGGMCCSGMYDLKPVRLSKRSRYVNFTDAMEEALSSQRHLDRLHAPLILGYGTYETPEFQRQNREMAAAVEAAGKPVQLLVGKGYNHFEILETLASPFGLLGRAVLQMMDLRIF